MVKTRGLWKLVFPITFLALLLVVPASADLPPPIPSGPYTPHSPAENIVKVETSYWTLADYINITFWVTMEKNTYPYTLHLLFTMNKTDGTEAEIGYWTGQVFGTLNTVVVNCAFSPYPDDYQTGPNNTPYVAVYAWLSGGTDRAPNTGFYLVTSYIAYGQTGIPDSYDDSNDPSQQPSNPYHYVGGELFSANKLAVLSPYLALISVVAVAAVVVKKKLA